MFALLEMMFPSLIALSHGLKVQVRRASQINCFWVDFQHERQYAAIYAGLPDLIVIHLRKISNAVWPMVRAIIRRTYRTTLG